MQGLFNVLLPSSAVKTSLPLPTLQEKPGEFWHTQSSTNLAECLSRSKESCQPLGLMHAVGQDKRTLGLAPGVTLGTLAAGATWAVLLYTLPGQSLILCLLHTTLWFHHLQEIRSGEYQDRSCGAFPVPSSVPEESKLVSAPPCTLKRAGLGVVCLDERQNSLL